MTKPNPKPVSPVIQEKFSNIQGQVHVNRQDIKDVNAEISKINPQLSSINRTLQILGATLAVLGGGLFYQASDLRDTIIETSKISVFNREAIKAHAGGPPHQGVAPELARLKEQLSLLEDSYGERLSRLESFVFRPAEGRELQCYDAYSY